MNCGAGHPSFHLARNAWELVREGNTDSVSTMRNLVGRGNFVALGVLVLCVILTSVNIHQLRRMQADFMSIQASTG